MNGHCNQEAILSGVPFSLMSFPQLAPMRRGAIGTEDWRESRVVLKVLPRAGSKYIRDGWLMELVYIYEC